MSATDQTPLKNKVAVITGASSGIGSATAQELDAAGMKLVLVARSEKKLLDVQSKLTSASILPLDVTQDGAAEKAIEFAQQTYGDLDVLINNAGMMAIGAVEELDLDKAMAMVRLNVEAAFRLAILAARVMKARGDGFIVNLSSVAGLKTAPGMAVYNGTKFAIEGFSDALRIEMAQSGVRVGSVQPGTVNTNLYDTWSGDQLDLVHSGGALEADDVARSILFMLEQPAHLTIGRLFAMPSRSGI